ncbi:hypothetical protein Tco_1042156 [Tanacetum coccineum]|uniref:Zf-CCHC domain-containing protein/UBN2 domain-containing protein n=1 Tax=Tanacetum coccineum TaxID=301880 RepID=A0ABQ5GJQ4_9ASTR
MSSFSSLLSSLSSAREEHSLKALDEGYSSKNYVRKFLRALHPTWRAKVTAIEESKDLTSLSLDELIGNLKVYEMIIKKDSEIVKAKGERWSLALTAKKESSDGECSTSKNDKNGKSERKFFRCGDPNHLIGKCLKPPIDKNQRAFIGGSWRNSGEEDDEKIKDEMCLVAQASNVIIMANLPPPNNDPNVPEDEHAPAPEHAPIAPNPAPIQPNDYLADDDEHPEEEEKPIPEQAPAGFAPQWIGWHEPNNNNGWIEEDNEEEVEAEEEDEEEIEAEEGEDMEVKDNDNENDAEIIHPYKEAGPLNRPPYSPETTEHELMNALVSRSTLQPIPPIRQFTGTFM